MADKLLKEHLYGDLLAPATGYSTDFALGMTYSLSFEAILTAHLAFGMLGEMDDNVIQSPHILLEAITKSSGKVAVFCNKGSIVVPPTIRKVFSLMERNIFEVFDKNNNKANFHPKLWLIREVNNDDKKDVQLKLIVTSRNLAYTDTIDSVACITGKVGSSSVNNEKHQPLVSFIKEVADESNIGHEQKKSVLKLATDLKRVEHFEVDAPFENYDFFPYLFNKDFGLPNLKEYLVGTESIIVSPFIDKNMINKLNPENKCQRRLITRKEYVDKDIFDRFSSKGGIYVTQDDLASRGMDLHAKMYHVWYSREAQYLFLGSANATTSAFERNGEFLLRLKYKYGNTRSGQFLSSFYEEGNSDSKFMPLAEPMEDAAPTIKWNAAESAMKDLMCADDLKARITHHRDGNYSIVVTSSIRKLINDVYIAPLQKNELMQRWTSRASFDELRADELSEFYIISAKSPEGTEHKTIIKIATTGMPSERDQEIYKGIIKSKRDFFRFIELMLTDTPLEYISSEMLLKDHGRTGGTSDDGVLFPSLYEKMLKTAAMNPAQIKEIEKLVGKLGDEVVPPLFLKIYKQFVSALN
jgi:HKD family nuclease